MPRQLEIIDLGVKGYDDAYAEQVRRVEDVVAARDRGGRVGFLLLVSHPPVITVSRRAGAGAHLLATPELLASKGIEVRETDRGGDITYHGPGQLVVYPILDLNLLNLGLHEYMRMLEQAVIDTCEEFGVRGERDSTATGVWVAGAKICAFGVRVRKWVSMHGLALNVETDLSHFELIVPCGLHGRPVTSVKSLLGDKAPKPALVREKLAEKLSGLIDAARRRAQEKRDAVGLGEGG